MFLVGATQFIKVVAKPNPQENIMVEFSSLKIKTGHYYRQCFVIFGK